MVKPCCFLCVDGFVVSPILRMAREKLWFYYRECMEVHSRACHDDCIRIVGGFPRKDNMGHAWCCGVFVWNVYTVSSKQ